MQASSIAELLNSKSTLFDSPGALMNAEFQAYPYTPLASTITAAGSSPSPGLQSTLQTAQKHREQANATLEDVSKLFQAVSMDKLADLEAPFARVSPGHFLLHQAGSGRALGSPIPTSSVHHAQSPGQRLLQVALSSGYKARSKASTPASRFSVVSPAAGGTSPHSRLSFSPGVQATPSMQPSPASGCANGTSRKLLNLQKRHAQLLEDCQAAEKAATEASEHRRRADADVAAATTRLRELKSAIKLHEGQVAELVSEQQERTAQLEQMSELLGARQQQAAEAAAAMQAAREEAQHAQHALAEINARVEDARAEEAALRGRLGELRGCVDEAEAVHEMLSELQYQLGEATEQLNAIKEQRDVAEAAAVEAEARRAAAEADLGEVTGALTIHGQAATLAEGLSAEVEALLTEKEARAEAALQRWEGAEEGLARASTALVEVTARLEARRALVAEAERRLRVAESQAEDAAAWATEAERASKAAECEMEACKARLAAAQAEEEAANERCIAALARAAAAEECARAKESLAEQLTQEEHALRGRCADAEALERRVLQLKAEVGEGEAAAALKAQLQMVSAECDRLREELAQAHQASADDFELNRCMDEEVARLKEQAMAAVAQSSALSGALEAERRGRVAAEEEAQRAQQAMHAALAEVDR